MKKKTTTFFALLLAISFCAAPCLQAEDTNGSRWMVKVDPRIELYIITAYLSDSFFKRWLNTNIPGYLTDIDLYFSEYKSHKAVEFFENTWKSDMSSYIPPEVMIYLSQNFEEQEDLPIPQDIIDHIGGQQKTEEFLSLAKDFYSVTNFDRFFNAHKDFYETLISPVKDMMTANHIVPNLTEYFGLDFNSYTVLLVPMLGFGNGYGPALDSKGGQRDIFCLLSPLQKESQIASLIWHEFSHSFIDPIVHKNLDKINQYEALYSPISSSMKPLYEDWESCLSEHLVKTVTSRIFLKLDREAEALQLVRAHTSQNFIYIKPLYDKLEEYEQKRTIYPTFEEFIPKILGTLKELSSKTRAESGSTKMFKGPINSLSKNVK